MTALKAIETRYKGYRFRSRLEARWAVFFDSLKIPWVYEPEGFDINGIWYLPDFFLPTFEVYAEVKPKIFSQDEFQLIASLNGLALDGLPDAKVYVRASSLDTCCQYAHQPKELYNREYNVGNCCYDCCQQKNINDDEIVLGIDLIWSVHKKKLWVDYGTGSNYNDNYSKHIEASRSIRFGEH